MKRERELALEWWNNLSYQQKLVIGLQYETRSINTLTGREIEKIWKDEIN